MRYRVGIRLAVAVLAVAALGFSGVAVAQTPTAPPHENPEEVDGDADPAALQRWFAGQMGEIHVDCSEGLVVGNFDACEELDGEYDSYLERYVTVERETTDNESDRQGDDYEETREEQQDLAETVREFRETRRAYEEARESGDEGEARRRARALQRLADRIAAVGGNVSAGFRQLDGSTTADLATAANRTETVVEDANETAREAVTASLVRTGIDVDADAEASYAAPATLAGSIRTDNGSAVAGGEVRIRDGAGTNATAPVGADGAFEATYRPTTTGLGETAVTVEFVPPGTSPYLGSEETATVAVRQTETNVTVDRAPGEAAYGDAIGVAGTVTAAGDGPAGVPVAVSVGDRVIASDVTGADGAFEITGSLPASVPAGNATLAVRGGESETALAPTVVSRSLSVAETETDLTAEVTYDGDRARVSGRLTTADGDPVGGQTVTLSAGEATRTARTTAEGNYDIAIDRPSEGREATVRYAESSSNLGDSRATVTLSPQSGGVAGAIDGVAGAVGAGELVAALQSAIADDPVFAAIFVVFVLANLGFWPLVAWRLLRWWRDDDGEAAQDGDAGADGDGGETGVASEATEDPEPAVGAASTAEDRLADARAALDGAPTTAVQLAFATVRSGLGFEESSTHWEVYRDASRELDGEREAALRSVVEAFEAATFSGQGVDRERARDAIREAERCLFTGDGVERAVGGDGDDR